MNQSHFDILKQGVKVWNAWRELYPKIRPDLSGALLTELLAPEINFTRTDLSRAVLYHADLERSMLIGANLNNAILIEACLDQCFFSGTRLARTSFNSASLRRANFMRSILTEVDLSHADLDGSDFRMARLERVNLEFALLNGINLSNACLENCLVHGMKGSVFETRGLRTKNLIVSNHADPTVVMDDFAAAAAIFACWQLDEAGRTAPERRLVIVLGNFQNERRELLIVLRRELQSRGFVPAVFHFDKPLSRTFLDVTRQIAALARYIIVDFTPSHQIDANFLAALPYFKLPIQAIAVDSAETQNLKTLQQYPWILEPYFYKDSGEVAKAVGERIIEPVERKAGEIFGVINNKNREQ